MTNSHPYRYDATAFREVFEHHFTYLARVLRDVQAGLLERP